MKFWQWLQSWFMREDTALKLVLSRLTRIEWKIDTLSAQDDDLELLRKKLKASSDELQKAILSEERKPQ